MSALGLVRGRVGGGGGGARLQLWARAEGLLEAAGPGRGGRRQEGHGRAPRRLWHRLRPLR